MLRLRSRYGSVYDGPVVFSDGAHYPAGSIDKYGNDKGPNRRRRLLWDADNGVYRYARPDDPTHLSLYHRNELEVVPGSED